MEEPVVPLGVAANVGVGVGVWVLVPVGVRDEPEVGTGVLVATGNGVEVGIGVGVAEADGVAASATCTPDGKIVNVSTTVLMIPDVSGALMVIVWSPVPNATDGRNDQKPELLTFACTEIF